MQPERVQLVLAAREVLIVRVVGVLPEAAGDFPASGGIAQHANADAHALELKGAARAWQAVNERAMLIHQRIEPSVEGIDRLLQVETGGLERVLPKLDAGKPLWSVFACKRPKQCRWCPVAMAVHQCRDEDFA